MCRDQADVLSPAGLHVRTVASSSDEHISFPGDCPISSLSTTDEDPDQRVARADRTKIALGADDSGATAAHYV